MADATLTRDGNALSWTLAEAVRMLTANAGRCRTVSPVHDAVSHVAEDLLTGLTHVTVIARKPAAPEQTWKRLLLVDTGAADSLVPGKHLTKIGLRPKALCTCEFAHGYQVKMDFATGELESIGDAVATTLIFGADGAEPPLVVTELESPDIEGDPRTQQLEPLPATRLKCLAPAQAGHSKQPFGIPLMAPQPWFCTV